MTGSSCMRWNLFFLLGLTSSISVVAAEQTWLIMGTKTVIRGPDCLSPAERETTQIQAIQVLQETERRYSTWTSGSELARLNLSRDPTRAPHPLVQELEKVMKLSSQWEGAFHPGLGRWVLASGIRSNPPPAPSKIGKRLKELGKPPQFAEKDSIADLLKNPDWIFEEGGFAKGLALDLIPLPKTPCGIEINLGGQILHRGPHPTRVQIASPINRSKPWIELTVQNESVATSSQSENPGHLIDPRTGLPSRNRGSATAIHPSALEADIAATAIAILGPKAPARLDWIYLEPSGHAYAPRRLQNRIKSLVPLHWHWIE